MAEETSTDKMSGNPTEEKSPRSVKRKYEDSEAKNKILDIEPVEKRQAFKLTPPTLIHGVAKPAPKDVVSTNTGAAFKKSFLRPSRLGPPVVSQPVTSTAPPLPSSTIVLNETKLPSSNHAISNNPFLKPIADEESDQPKNTDNVDPPPESNGCTGKISHASGLSQENSFLKMTSEPVVSHSESPSASDSTEFVFGRKMAERVIKTGPESETKEEKSSDFVFGANLSERVKFTAAESNTLQTAPAESAIFRNSVKQDSKSGTNGRELEKSAAVLFNASNTKVIMPEVEIKTGEEDEKNVLQIQCKLYQYDSSNVKNWIERGRGNLRLNDLRISADQKFQSRLVMRTNGSLRLILNTKIWASTVVEKADTKSVRISAQTEDGEIGVFLIMAPINDADHLFRAIEYRVLHLKQLEEKCKPITTEKCEPNTEKPNDVPPADLPPSDTTNTTEPPVTATKEDTNISAKETAPEAEPVTTLVSTNPEVKKKITDCDTAASAPVDQNAGFHKEEECSK